MSTRKHASPWFLALGAYACLAAMALISLGGAA